MDVISTRLAVLQSVYESYLAEPGGATRRAHLPGAAPEEPLGAQGRRAARTSPPARSRHGLPGAGPSAAASAESGPFALQEVAEKWLQHKLLDVMNSLDSLLDAAVRDRRTLVAINEDLTETIHCTASTLGYSADQYLSAIPAQSTPIKHFDTLRRVQIKLNKELGAHRAIISNYFEESVLLARQLGNLPDDMALADFDGIPDPASPAMVYLLKAQHSKLKFLTEARMGQLVQMAKEIVDLESELDDNVIPTPTYSQTMVWKLKGEPDIIRPPALSAETSSALSKFVESLAVTDWDSTGLPPPLSLSWDFLELLSQHLSNLRNERTRRQELRDALCAEIRRLWEELEWEEEKRDPAVSSFLKSAKARSTSMKRDELDLLEAERTKLIAVLRTRLQELVDDYSRELVQLREKCMADQLESESFDNKLRQLAGNLEAKHLLLRSEVDAFRLLYAKCGHLFSLIKERASLIQDMKDFEASASNPDRLFGSSFRLLAEEKWRRMCYPNLVSLESQLMQAIATWEDVEGTEFIHRGKRHMDFLQAEIQDRFVNQTFFNFSAAASKSGGSRPATAASLRSLPAATAHERNRQPGHTKRSESANVGQEPNGTPASRSPPPGSTASADASATLASIRPTPRLGKPSDGNSFGAVRRSSSYGSLSSVSKTGSRSSYALDKAVANWTPASGNRSLSHNLGKGLRDPALSLRATSAGVLNTPRGGCTGNDAAAKWMNSSPSAACVDSLAVRAQKPGGRCPDGEGVTRREVRIPPATAPGGCDPEPFKQGLGRCTSVGDHGSLTAKPRPARSKEAPHHQRPPIPSSGDVDRLLS